MNLTAAMDAYLDSVSDLQLAEDLKAADFCFYNSIGRIIHKSAHQSIEVGPAPSGVRQWAMPAGKSKPVALEDLPNRAAA